MMEKRWFGLGLGAAMSGRRKMGWRLGRGVGPMRSGGRKKKKMKGRREGQWLGSAASGGRGRLDLSRGDGSIDSWAGEMVRQGGGREKNIYREWVRGED